MTKENERKIIEDIKEATRTEQVRKGFSRLYRDKYFTYADEKMRFVVTDMEERLKKKGVAGVTILYEGTEDLQMFLLYYEKEDFKVTKIEYIANSNSEDLTDYENDMCLMISMVYYENSGDLYDIFFFRVKGLIEYLPMIGSISATVSLLESNEIYFGGINTDLDGAVLAVFDIQNDWLNENYYIEIQVFPEDYAVIGYDKETDFDYDDYLDAVSRAEWETVEEHSIGYIVYMTDDEGEVLLDCKDFGYSDEQHREIVERYFGEEEE